MHNIHDCKQLKTGNGYIQNLTLTIASLRMVPATFSGCNNPAVSDISIVSFGWKTKTKLPIRRIFSSKKNGYLITPQNYMLWVLIRSASMRHF